MVWFFLTSGLFLGWSLGANDAGNIFGTAVGSKMVRFTTAAVITSVFIILGATLSGAATTKTIGALGDVNAIAGSFTVSFSAALTVLYLIKRGLPISVSQSIVGAIIGWNLFTSSPTDIGLIISILLAWIANPIMSLILSFILYKAAIFYLKKLKLHILSLDNWTRILFFIIISFGAYSLGANNIAKVVGVFITSNPFTGIKISDNIVITPTIELFFVGACSMAAGIITYSRRTIRTIGSRIYKLTPISALCAVSASSLVLFLFSSAFISDTLNSVGIPSLPHVPVSITQAMVGGVMGIGFAKGGRYLNYKILRNIGVGWLITPVASGIISVAALFIMQNVFQQKVYDPVNFELNSEIKEKIKELNIDSSKINKIDQDFFTNQSEFRQNLYRAGISKEDDIYKIFQIAKIEFFRVDSNYAKENLNPNIFTYKEIESVKKLHGESFLHRWQLLSRLRHFSDEWNEKPDIPKNEPYNKMLQEKLDIIYSIFKVK